MQPFYKSTSTGLVKHLIEDQLITETQAENALHKSAQENSSFTYCLVQSGVLSSKKLYDYSIKKFNYLSIFDLKHYDLSWIKNSNISLEFIARYHILPLPRSGNFLPIAITDPTDHTTISAISYHTGSRVQAVLVDETILTQIIETYCRPAVLNLQMETALAQISPLEITSTQPSINENDDEPVIEYINHLINNAIEEGVSDIHIEPGEKYCRVRFRRDGELRETARILSSMSNRITLCLKVMANLDITERRLPQDGRIHFQNKIHPKYKVNIRINTCPTLFGEKMVLRILDKHKYKLNLEELGLTNNQLEILQHTLIQPQGLILVTGPTGSGKTLTLYSAIHYLNQETKNILSAEDPVEIELKGINQVNVNSKIGLNFATALRNFLRQDPDIILIGEIRDYETAHIALQAAQTGHLVLSSLHTNSAIDSITRLNVMGISTYQLSSSISLMLAQRLVRKLCIHCRKKNILSKKEQAITPSYLKESFYPSGCKHCQQGYQGRIAIFELIPMTEALSQLILSRGSKKSLNEYIKQQNIFLLKEAAWEKVQLGITSIAEIKRVLSL